VFGSSYHLNKLDSVNWLINQWTNQTLGSSYTYGDVQQAIYTMLGDGLSSSSLLGPWDATRVAQLVSAATSTGDGFVPDTVDADADDIDVQHQEPADYLQQRRRDHQSPWDRASILAQRHGDADERCVSQQSAQYVQEGFHGAGAKVHVDGACARQRREGRRSGPGPDQGLPHRAKPTFTD
jgi:hypothetical protein